MTVAPPIVVGMTGASGAPYALRLVEVLRAGGAEVHLSISPSAAEVILQETGWHVDLDRFDPHSLWPASESAADERRAAWWGAPPRESAAGRGSLAYHHWRDFRAPIASGSFLTAGMVVCPCSGTTLSAIAAGAAGNLIQRAAEVHLKERRRLVLVPRETPVSLLHIENMRRASEAGAVMLPASPGWYHGVHSLSDLVDFVVGRICDQLGVANGLIRRWGE